MKASVRLYTNVHEINPESATTRVSDANNVNCAYLKHMPPQLALVIQTFVQDFHDLDKIDPWLDEVAGDVKTSASQQRTASTPVKTYWLYVNAAISLISRDVGEEGSFFVALRTLLCVLLYPLVTDLVARRLFFAKEPPTTILGSVAAARVCMSCE